MADFSDDEFDKDILFNPGRLQTQNIRNAFEVIEQNDHNKTNLQFLHNDTCFCMEAYDDENDICIFGCGHSLHKECLNEYLDKTTTHECPTCRTQIVKISSIEWGHCTLQEFKDRYESEQQLFAQSVLHRQVTCGGYYGRQNTIRFQATQQSYDFHEDNRHLKNGIVLPEIPLLSSTGNVSMQVLTNPVTEQKSAVALHSNTFSLTFNYETHNLGTFALIAPFQESVSSELKADVIIVLDVSGSMEGNKLEECKKAIKTLFESINGKTQIRVTLITFDDYAVHEFPLQLINSTNYENIFKRIESLEVNGGTNYNVAFKLLEKVLSDRDSIVFFFSDGEPSIATDLDILRSIYTKCPLLTMYVVSIGEDVDAEKALIPLLCDRHHDLAVYKHFSNLNDFPVFIANAIGETTAVYATDITIRFKNVIPISSKCETDENGISIINVPLLRFNDMTQFAFTRNTTEIAKIQSIYTVNGVQCELSSLPDTINLVGETLSVHFALKRLIDRECNSIRLKRDLTNTTKKEIFQNILRDITPEQLGSFYDEFKNGLKALIESIEYVSTRNRNSINTLSQMQNRSASAGRHLSLGVSRAVSNSLTPH